MELQGNLAGPLRGLLGRAVIAGVGFSSVAAQESVQEPREATLAESDWVKLVEWAGEALAAVDHPVDLDGVGVEVVALKSKQDSERLAERWRGWTAPTLPTGLVEARNILVPAMSSFARGVNSRRWESGEPTADWFEEESLNWVIEFQAFFHAAGKRIYVLGNAQDRGILEFLGEFEPWHVAVHEAAHAGQLDFGLGSVFKTTEERCIKRALLEGEADLAMLAVHSALDRVALETRSKEWVAAELSRLFERPKESPYDVGCAFLFPSLARGGWLAVRTVLESPPSSSEQILHPIKLGSDEPVAVGLPPWPAARGKPAMDFEDVWGEWGIAQLASGTAEGMLSQYPPPWTSQVLSPDLADVHTGWDGDRLAAAVFADGTQAIMWRTVWDRDVDADQFVEFFRDEFEGRWARSPHIADWVWSTDPMLEDQLLDAMEQVPQALPDPQDCESTATIERR